VKDCHKCGFNVYTWKFCPKCGNDMRDAPPKQCSNCGIDRCNFEDYCRDCGNKY